MGFLTKAYDFAEKTGLLKKAKKLINKNGGASGILGKASGIIGRFAIPESYRNIGSAVADTALSMMPDSDMKKALINFNNGAQNRKITNNFSQTKNKYNKKISKKELKYLKKMRRKDGESNYNSADSVIIKSQTPYGTGSKRKNKSYE